MKEIWLTAHVVSLCVAKKCNFLMSFTGGGSSVSSEAAWDASGFEINHVWLILLLRFNHENISLTILPLPLIQEEHLSVNGKRMYTKYW